MQSPQLDPAALASLDNVEFVRRLARSLLRDPHQADDLAQDTWRVALERADVPKSRAWLAGVVRKLALGRVRAGLRRSEVEQLAAAQVRAEAQAGSLSQHVDPMRLIEVQQLLLRAVGALAPDRRDAIVMRYFEGLNSVEIAERIGARPATVRQRLARGLADLRQRMESEGDPREGSWRAALAPIALRDVASTSAVLTSVLSLKWIAGGVAAVCLALALRALLPTGAGAPAPQPPPVPTASGLEDAAERDTSEQPPVAAAADPTRLPVSSPSAATPLRIEVVDAGNGLPLPGARAWIDTGAGIEPETALENGTLELPPPTELRLAVAAAGHVPRFVAALPELAPGEPLTVAMNSAERLGGRVFFDPAQAPDVAPFVLHTQDVEVSDDWPDDFAAAMGLALPWGGEHPVPVKPDGRFEVDGLPSGWRGGLWVHTRFRFESVTPEPAMLLSVWSEFKGPEDQLEMHLYELPVMTGRVRWANELAPVTDARVELIPRFEDGTKSTVSWVPVDSEGRFSLGIAGADDRRDPPPVTGVRIRVYPVGGLILKSERDDLAGTELNAAGDMDIGELLVERVPEVFAVVRSSAGEPISGAVVLPLPADAKAPPLAPVHTGADGRFQVSGLDLKGARLLVGANSFASTAFEIERRRGESEEPLELLLAPATRLRIAVDAPPELFNRLDLELGPDGPPYAELAGDVDVPAEALAQLRAILRGSNQRFHAYESLRLGDEGRLDLTDLRPGAEVELRIASKTGLELHRETVTLPDAGLHEVAVQLDPPTVQVRGRLIDAAGDPLPGVSKGLRLPGGEQWHRPETALDGTFVIDEILEPDTELSLLLHRAGLVERAIPLPIGLTEHDLGDLPLVAGRSVDLTVTDALGRTLRPDQAWAELDTGELIGGLIFASHSRLDSLPELPATIHVDVGGRFYTAPLGSAQAELRLDLPAHGRLHFTPAEGASASAPSALRIEPVDADTRPLDRPAFESWSVELLPGTYRLIENGETREILVEAGGTTDLEGR